MSQDSLRAQHPDARDWTVVRTYHDFTHLSVRMTGSDSAAQWIARLRSLYPILQQRSPSDLLSEVRRSGCIDLGCLAGREAYRLAQMLQEHEFDVLRTDASAVSYFPMVSGSGVIIEDELEATAFCLDLIREGATLQKVEG